MLDKNGKWRPATEEELAELRKSAQLSVEADKAAREIREAKMYETFHSEFGLKSEWLGKTFTDKVRTYTITGLNPRSKRYPVLTDSNVSFSVAYATALMTKTVSQYHKKQQEEHDKKQAKLVELSRTYFPTECRLYDLEPTDLDKQFMLSGVRYQVVGIDSNRRRYPIVIRVIKTGVIAGYTAEGTKLALQYPEDELARRAARLAGGK